MVMAGQAVRAAALFGRNLSRRLGMKAEKAPVLRSTAMEGRQKAQKL